MKVSFDWLQDFVPLKGLGPEKIAEHLTMAGLEVKRADRQGSDWVLETEVTTNRPDWLSHIGVAREIAAIQGTRLKLPSTAYPRTNRSSAWKIELEETDGCPYYTGVYLEGISPCPTPDFMRERLKSCGLRSINLIVDVTNYVLLETGQPLHAFDADKLQGKIIQARKAKPGELFTAIDGAQIRLKETDLVIADRARAVALAGVMGGKESEVSGETKNVFLESAFFSPRWVRRTSRRVGLQSDSSYRFERRVDPEGVDFARERAVSLIVQYAKPSAVYAAVRGGRKPGAHPVTIPFHNDMTRRALGISVKAADIQKYLSRLGLRLRQSSKQSWKVEIPSFRSDLRHPVDLIEEIARLHGYENIAETLPSRPPLNFKPNELWVLEQEAARFLAGVGFYEAVTFSLISSRGFEPMESYKALSLANPQNREWAWLRPSLVTSLLQVIQHNVARASRCVPVFEIANVYRSEDGKSVSEKKALGIVLWGKWRAKSWLDPERDAAYYDLKGLLQGLLSRLGIKDFSFVEDSRGFLSDPGAEQLRLGNVPAGYLGEVRPEIYRQWDLDTPVYYAEIFLDSLLRKRENRVYEALPRFPAVERDLALVVAEAVQAGNLIEEIKERGGGLIREVELFDLFRGGRIPQGKKNLAFRVTYQSLERTLRSEEIQELHGRIAGSLAEKYQASFQ